MKRRRRSAWKQNIRYLMKDPVSVVCISFIVVLIGIMIFADLIVPYEDGIKIEAANRLLKPCREHIFGCDSMGRDLFARMIHGTRISMSMGIIMTAIVMIIGTFLGAMCAYYGGIFDMLLMRVCEIIECIPGILMALTLAAALGPGRLNLLIAISVSTIPGVIRTFRMYMLNVIGNDYIEAARACGASDLHIITKHVLPNVMAYILMMSSNGIAGIIMSISGFSYIGIGIQLPEPEWGAMLSEARNYLLDAPHLMVIPGITILLVSLAFKLLGDTLRDLLDPRLKAE